MSLEESQHTYFARIHLHVYQHTYYIHVYVDRICCVVYCTWIYIYVCVCIYTYHTDVILETYIYIYIVKTCVTVHPKRFIVCRRYYEPPKKNSEIGSQPIQFPFSGFPSSHLTWLKNPLFLWQWKGNTRILHCNPRSLHKKNPCHQLEQQENMCIYNKHFMVRVSSSFFFTNINGAMCLDQVHELSSVLFQSKLPGY